jgi:hypothetical protein
MTAKEKGVSPLFKKLNLSQHSAIVVLNTPAEFEAELSATMPSYTVLNDNVTLAESLLT